MKKSRWMILAGSALAALALLAVAIDQPWQMKPAMAIVTPPPRETLIPYLTPEPHSEISVPLLPTPTPLAQGVLWVQEGNEPDGYVTPEPTLTPLPMATAAQQDDAQELPATAEIPPLPAVESIGTITENVVVALSTIAPSPTDPIVLYVEPVNVYEIDLESYYGSNKRFLNEAETKRLAKAQERWANGERPEASVLNLTENVVVGVYGLPAEQYQGESAFLLLPNSELTDEQCLQIVDAYEQLGLTFDAANVSWRNCMRGGSIECTRSWAGDEAERYASLTELYKRGGLRPETAFTALPGDDGMGEIALNEEAYNGLGGFLLRPARRLTDQEILQIIAEHQGEEPVSSADYAVLESQLRTQMHTMLGMDLSARRISEEVHKESDYAIWGSDRLLYDAQFKPVNEDHPISAWSGYLDLETRKLAYAHTFCNDQPYCDVHEDPFAQKWSDTALSWLAQNRTEPYDPETVTVECMGEAVLQDCGYGAQYRLTMEDGSSYTLIFHFSDGSLHTVDYRDAQRSAREDSYYMTMYALMDKVR